METDYGSLTRGMLAAHKMMRAKMAAARSASANGAGATGQGGETRARPLSIFTTLKGGLQQLVDALEARLNPKWVRKSTSVSALDRIGDGWRVRSGDADETYDAVIVASPAGAAGALLAATDARLGDELGALTHPSSLPVNH